ncbi:MAG TPA: hypothetical protein VGD26_09550 [Chitinophagaceae bacterium]
MEEKEHKENSKEFFLTQTALKDLEKDTTCPDRWRALWLDKEIEFPSNEDMDKGKYFEWLCLGGGAISGEDVTDLPRTATGRKSAEHTRIDEQAERFQQLFSPSNIDFQGFEITRSQIELKVGNRKGTIDFETKHLQTGEIWINDLKLTRDAESTRSQYGWGHNWSDLDMVQLVHYRDLYTDVYGITPRVGLWVFDYSPNKLVKFGEVVISEKAREKKELRFETALEVIELYKKNGWTKIHSEYECKSCKLSCSVRFKQPPIEKFKVNI